MSPKKVHLNAFSLVGSKIRTSNANEGSEIGTHWHSAFQKPEMQTIKNKKTEMPFGLYTNYESDHTGEFDHLVAFDGESSDELLTSIEIKESNYLVFDASGEQPDGVINAWGNIWTYFETHSEITRSYLADFEEYKSETDVIIYIGVK